MATGRPDPALSCIRLPCRNDAIEGSFPTFPATIFRAGRGARHTPPLTLILWRMNIMPRRGGGRAPPLSYKSDHAELGGCGCRICTRWPSPGELLRPPIQVDP